jgi:hypothetical protein
MPFLGLLFCTLSVLAASFSRAHGAQQAPLQQPRASAIPSAIHSASNDSSISVDLFAELEELARIVDISYCVGSTGLGIQKPFQCLSRCSEFESFELVKVRHCWKQPQSCQSSHRLLMLGTVDMEHRASAG